MKHISWNKVTWYSKMLAVFLFFAVWLIGIYLGSELQKFPSFQASLSETSNALEETDSIAVGKPCNIKKLPSYGSYDDMHQRTNTHGLQCHIYGEPFPDLSDPEGIAGRHGIWVQPNSLPLLPLYGKAFGDDSWTRIHEGYEKSLDFMVKDWATYTSPDKKLSFKYPADQWNVVTDKKSWPSSQSKDPFIISIQAIKKHPWDELEFMPFEIEYFPYVKFYQDGPDAPSSFLMDFPGGTTSLNDHLEFFQSFTVNKAEAYAVTRLPAVVSGTPGLYTTFYIINGSGYLKFTYTRDSNLEAFIRTIHFQ